MAMKRVVSWVYILDCKMTENGPKIKYSDVQSKTLFADTHEELDDKMEDFLNDVVRASNYEIDDIAWSRDMEC